MKNDTAKTEKQQSLIFKDSAEIANELKCTNPDSFLFYIKVCANFEKYDVRAGDCLIVHRAKKYDENQLSFWIDHEGDSLVGFAYDNFGDISINFGDDEPFRYKPKQLEFKGNVVGIIRCLDYQRSQTPVIEITAACGKCKKETTGTPEFIKSQGWELEENGALCLTCDLYN